MLPMFRSCCETREVTCLATLGYVGGLASLAHYYTRPLCNDVSRYYDSGGLHTSARHANVNTDDEVWLPHIACHDA